LRYPWTDSDVPTEWFREGVPPATSLVEAHYRAHSRRAEYWQAHPRERFARLLFGVCFILGGLATIWLLFTDSKAFPEVWRSIEGAENASIWSYAGDIILYLLSYTFIFGVFAWIFANVYGSEAPLHIWLALWSLSGTIVFASAFVRALFFFQTILFSSGHFEQLLIVAWIFGLIRFLAVEFPLRPARRR